MTQIVETIPAHPSAQAEAVLARKQGEPVPGNTRPGGSDGATE